MQRRALFIWSASKLSMHSLSLLWELVLTSVVLRVACHSKEHDLKVQLNCPVSSTLRQRLCCCDCRTDRVTSVMIPLAFTAVGLFVGGKGLYHMYTGTGKLE